MKKTLFIAVFIGAHIIFIFLQIHKHSQVIHYSYEKQKKETQKNNLIQKRQLVEQQQYAIKNRSTIKQFAGNVLRMKKVKLSQIKKLPTHE